MTTAREEFEARKLEAKYGVPGKVAALYRRAGYQVKMEDAEGVDFLAWRRGEKLAVKVYSASGQVPMSVVDALIEEAGKHSAKPVIVLYGAGPRLTGEVREAAKQKGASVRRVRF